MAKKTLLARIFQFKNSMMFPTVLVLAMVIIIPLGYSLFISFHKYFLQFGLENWVYLKNYINAFHNVEFLISMKNTFVLTFAVVSIEFVLALGLALILNREDLKFKHVYIIILMIPVMIPPIAVGLIWRLLLHPDLGIVNYLLGFIGIPKLGWLGDPQLAMPTVIAVDVWHETALILIVLLAGLTSLDRTPFEAAKVDGASPIQIFFNITLPLLSPVILVALLIRMIAAIKTYDLIYILTRGGPGFRTETMSYYVYKMAFRKMSMGDASAMSFILLIIILFFCLILIRIMGERDT
ncbi:MAG: sugar ABC transporter permease [Deltaproteobacteria bacterium]|nr:MAG: sugar ABC transporter permease [Deltaproteobacteria bacterium]